jgi:hypothetical protein
MDILLKIYYIYYINIILGNPHIMSLSTLRVTDFLSASLHFFVGEKLTCKTTLGRLIKMLSKLDAEIAKLSGFSHNSNVGRFLQASTSRVCSHEQVISDLRAQRVLLAEQLAKKAQLEIDRLLLKALLHERNAVLKIDLIQAQLVMLKSLKDDLTSTLSTRSANQIGSVHIDELSEQHLVDLEARARDSQRRNSSLNPPTLSLQVSLVNSREIEEMLENVNLLITDLEDERDAINSRTKVTLELHPVTIKVLGLKPAPPKASSIPPLVEEEA